MRSYMHKEKIYFILLGFVFCMFFMGCNASTGQSNATSQSNKLEFNVPQEITMEFFGIDALKVNRGMWEEHIFSLYDPNISEYSAEFMVGDYKIMNSYLNFENKDNLSTYITYGGDSRGSSILFDENDDLKKICIESDMGDEFSTSFLNIGDNVKDYLESRQRGLWKKFLNDKANRVEQGWYIWHTVTEGLEYTYDELQISNDDIVVSYYIADECVDRIMLTVVGDIHIEESSIYQLDNFEFYINGTNISTMTIDDWTNFMYLPEADVCERKIVNEEFMEDPLTGALDTHTEVMGEWTEFYCPIEGTEIIIFGNIDAYSSRFELYNINNVNKVYRETETCYEILDYVEPDIVEFSVADDYVYRRMSITGSSGGITSDSIMPGDNIKTFLNSYEEGLYEKLTSLPENNSEYQVVPYYFSYFVIGDGTEGVIEIRKKDERNLPPITICFKDEIVTRIMIN